MLWLETDLSHNFLDACRKSFPAAFEPVSDLRLGSQSCEMIAMFGFITGCIYSSHGHGPIFSLLCLEDLIISTVLRKGGLLHLFRRQSPMYQGTSRPLQDLKRATISGGVLKVKRSVCSN
eukprot:TRINITY_DN2710_c1_g1_i7.p2 TRINITY_DN2710_c1_g1~~TRINITY_DN2710_c1_g1_i7.p2  ORF type:complete len:120 (-),score=7.00 TRINITY_DN2710_c1_g1_i7:644-1003(-)